MSKNDDMVIEKNGDYHTILIRETYWWASYHNRKEFAKKWFMVSFYLIFEKSKKKCLMNSSEGFKNIVKNASVFYAFFGNNTAELPIFFYKCFITTDQIFVSDE